MQFKILLFISIVIPFASQSNHGPYQSTHVILLCLSRYITNLQLNKSARPNIQNMTFLNLCHKNNLQ